MKIAIRSWGGYRDNLDGFGGLELRYTVHYAHFLRAEGHDVHFVNGTRRCDSSFDLMLDTPTDKCDQVDAKFHIHTWFAQTANMASTNAAISSNSCYQNGEMIIADPYRYWWENSTNGEVPTHNFKHVLFLPIPYPDDLIPKNLIPGFNRDVIFWGNKGNFNSTFGPETNMHYITNGIETLKALVKLNKKADFKTVFVLDQHIRETRLEYRHEIEDLISQLKNVTRLEEITWSQYLNIMSQTKINTHVGGLTSGINECLFTQGVPAVPESFLFFRDVASELKIVPPPKTATADDIYDAYERLWFDETYYSQVLRVFQEAFEDHRSPGIRKHWSIMQEILGV